MGDGPEHRIRYVEDFSVNKGYRSQAVCSCGVSSNFYPGDRDRQASNLDRWADKHKENSTG